MPGTAETRKFRYEKIKLGENTGKYGQGFPWLAKGLKVLNFALPPFVPARTKLR